MAPHPKVLKAFKAMAELGISEKQVKPALKNLLRVFDKNWELIEAESYRALIDAIFEAPETPVVEGKKKCTDEEDMEEEPLLHREPASLKRLSRGHESSSQKKKSANDDLENDTEEESLVHHQRERPLKRLRKTYDGQISPSPDACNPMLGGTSLIIPKLETDDLLGTCSPQQGRDIRRSPESRAELQLPISPHLGKKNKGKQPVVCKLLAPPERSEQLSRQAFQGERSMMGVRFKEKIVEPGIILMHKKNVNTHQLIKPKDEPFTDDMAHDEVPIAVILPEPSSEENPLLQNSRTRKQNDQEPMASQGRVNNGVLASSSERSTHLEVENIEEDSSDLEVASSPLGEVKLSFSCKSASARPDFHMPNIDAVLKLAEEKCLHSYKIIDPNFSLKNLLGHMCESFLELGTNANSESQDGSISISPSLDALGKSTVWDAVGGTKETLCTQSFSSNGTITIDCRTVLSAPQVPRLPLSLNGVVHCREPYGGTDSNGFAEVDKVGELENSHALVVVQQCDLTPDDLRSCHDMNDITKGEEKVSIPWVNEMNSECPPAFFYISRSLVFRDANVNFCLSDIGDGNCCATCFGNCLSLSAGCACASQTGGEFAYTPESLVKEDFLQDYISVTHNPQQQRSFYCKSCPLERVKDDDCYEPCKGHLRRKFIKECWSKCGCHRQCGNRVVQRGVNCKLQVFYTSEGKGWGLRTLEELPKGAFVCEYVGEVLTSDELHERNVKGSIIGKRPYPVLLDANWGSKVDLRNEEALSLDATNYGNVARFINHRCLDANLVGVPVEVETPSRYYYHLAFFTARKIDAFEELNRDYGIDFDDHDHPIKVFQCRCGSKFCRNMKRPNRSRSASITK